MLTQSEFLEFITAITPVTTYDDIIKYGSLASANKAINAEAIAYANRVLTYFEKKRKEDGR